MPAIILLDRVRDTSTTNGTGTLNLLAPVISGFRSFSASGIASGSNVAYSITDLATGAWEVGRGVVTSGSPWTLSRLVVTASSNSNNLVSFAGGNTKQIDLALAAPHIPTNTSILRNTVTAQTTLDLAFDSLASVFELKIWNLSMSAAAAGVNIRCLTAGVPDAGATDYSYQATGGNGATALNSQTVAGQIDWTGALTASVANGTINVTISPGSASSRFVTMSQFAGFESGGNMRNLNVGGARAANGAKSGIRLIATSGNFSFEYRMEGIG